LIALHAWAAKESFEVLDIFGVSRANFFLSIIYKLFSLQGWFYGDFFMEDFPAHLEYTGIFRYDGTKFPIQAHLLIAFT